MKYIKYTFIILVLIGFVYFISGQLLLPSETPNGNYNCQEFTADWTWVKPDGTRISITIPGTYDVARNEVMTIETTIPEDLGSHIKCLQFSSSRQDMQIFVDGVLRQQYSTAETRLFGKTSSGAYVILELNPTDAGKKLTVTFQSDSTYSGVLRTIHCGDKMSMWIKMFKDYGAELLVGFVMLILGLAASIISIILRRIYHKQNNLEYLGWGTTIVASWIVFNSIFRQLMFPNLSTASDITFLAVTLIPVPYLLYLNSVQGRRYEKWYNIIAGIVVADSVICSFLQVTNLVDFSASIKVILVICLSSIAFMAFTIICDIKKGYTQEYRLIIIGICSACLFAIAQIVLYYYQIETTFSGILIAVGLIILLFLATISTVTDLFSMEQEKKQAILANQAKATFLANMSHEIRTPINAVLGMDEMILRESTEEHVQEYAKDIQNAGRTLLTLINDILDFSKIESGKLEILPSEYDVSFLLDDCYNMTIGRANAKHLDFQIENNPNIPKRLFGDEIRIRQIILNLLSNAIKYTPQGRVVLTLDGQLVSDNQYVLQITVSDTGIGIKQENLDSLFDSFQRIEEKRNRNIEGTGLGLAITKQLVTLMKGEISVQSTYGVGSVFRVELPQTVNCTETLGDFSMMYAKPSSEIQEYHETFHAPQGRILIVDDIPINLKVLSALLKNTQLQVDTAESGQQCLELVKKNAYHIIFLDHMMPHMDGLETLQMMQQLIENKNRNTPVIMLTANAIVGAKEEYLENGFVDYLSKPVHAEKLEDMILKYLPQELVSYSGDEPAVTYEPAKEVSTLQPSAGESDAVATESKVGAADTSGDFTDRLTFLDTALGISYCNNDKDVYKMVLEAYIAAQSHISLHNFYEQEDWHSYSIEIHGIKSSSLTIGAVDISARAKALELAAKSGDIDFIRMSHDAFVDDYKQFLSQLENAL